MSPRVLVPRYNKPPACKGCVLETLGTGFVPSSGPITARLVFYAESPGPEEVIKGEPLVGAAGGVHSRILARAGIPREQVRMDNCIRCHPPNMWFDEKAPWYYPALAHCHAAYGHQSLAQVPTDGTLVTYGATALKQVHSLHAVEGVNVQNFHGTVSRDPLDRFWIIPTFHPSHLQRGAMKLLDVVTQDIMLAQRISEQGFVRSPCELVVDPSPMWFAAWVERHCDALVRDPQGVWLAIDTEFPEKTGADESEVVSWNRLTPMSHFNCSNSKSEGVSVPYDPAYRAAIEHLLATVKRVGGIVFAWNKYADLDHLTAAGHTDISAECFDLMWAWHYLQSDLPRGLGFVAAMASDFGAWKHWAKDTTKFGLYRTADGVQTYRCAQWIVPTMQQQGLWDVFLRDWHERDCYVLRPAHEVGVPIDKVELVAFHEELQRKQAGLLERIKQCAVEGSYRPKGGYPKAPRGKLVMPAMCSMCGKDKPTAAHLKTHSDTTETPFAYPAVYLPPTAPTSILGGKRKGTKGAEAKSAYLETEVRLVVREVDVSIRCCLTCGAAAVGPKHRCRRERPTRSSDTTGVLSTDAPAPQIVERVTRTPRWFWKLPFNPDATAQVLAYIAAQGHDAPVDPKTKKPTTSAAALKVLEATTGDPFYRYQLDWRAVQKVDSTYAVGTLERLDQDDHVHPEYLPIPSTLRDSARDPNLTNVVADKTGPESLAAGFRRCVEARDGVPATITQEEMQQWQQRWDRQL